MSAEENHIKHYSAEDIERYLNRQMTREEMYMLEKASLEDPFLAEAIEGYEANNVSSVSADIDELKERLAAKPDTKVIAMPPRRRIWWSVAAAILIVFGLSATWYWLNPGHQKDLADNKEKKEATVPPPTQTVESDKQAAVTDTMQITTAPSLGLTSDSMALREREAAPAAKAVELKEIKKDSISNKAKARALDISPSAAQPVTEQAAELNKIQSLDKPNKDIAESKSVPSPNAVAGRKNNNVADGFINAHLFKGRVTDEQNQPLPFANLNVNNSSVNTYTDAQGYFKLMSGDPETLVNIKSVGHQPTQFNLQSNVASNNIILKTDPKQLAEVVVIGYGSQRKKALQTR
ncbi:MAG: carboxypeptidase-like regulatory domain-containing protein [Agriterribacter sp.]